MEYELEDCYVATLRNDIPAITKPELIRFHCVDRDGADAELTAPLDFAQRINDRLRVCWREGEDELYEASLEPDNHNDNSENDYSQWSGEIAAKYRTYGGGLHADTTVSVTETGKIEGWMFETDEDSIFVGKLIWENERERVVIKLIEKQSDDSPAPKPARRNNQITGNVGMYYACYQLSKIGLNVLPTSRNAKGADIIAYSNDHERFFTIQVKAMSKLANISLGKSLKKVECEWWIIVFDVYHESQAYILARQEIVDSAKLYQDIYWAQKNEFANEEALNQWKRILK